MTAATLKSLIWVRWGARATLALGVIASGAANVLHAEPNLVSRAISAWPPFALLFAVELIARVPIHRRWVAGIRWTAASLLAGIAAWVSYWHMAAVASTYGETGSSAYLLPLTVDGLVVVASISLVELNARIRAHAGIGPEAMPKVDVVVAQPNHREPIGMVGAVVR